MLELGDGFRLAQEADRGDRVRVGAGARWGDVASTLGSHGLSLTSGDTRSVGVGGLTTGGGIGSPDTGKFSTALRVSGPQSSRPAVLSGMRQL